MPTARSSTNSSEGKSSCPPDPSHVPASTPLRCIYWNVRSISGKKKKQLQNYINRKQADLLFLSETWQRKGQPLPELEGYNLISCMSDEHTGGRGGVACYFRTEFEPFISCFKKDPQGHYLWLKIDKELGFETDLFIAVCYFPPISSTAYKGRNRTEENFPFGGLNDDIALFTEKNQQKQQEIDQEIEEGHHQSCDFLVVGDFNSRIGDAQAPEAHRHGLVRESADKKVNKFGLPLMDVCAQNDLIICNGVTQVWPRSGETTCRSRSVVDYLLAPVSRGRYLLKDLRILPLEKKSDHNAITFSLRRPHPVALNFSSIIKTSKEISDVADEVETAEIKAVMRTVTSSSTASSDKEEIEQPDESCRKLPHVQQEEGNSEGINIITKKQQSRGASGAAKMSNNGMGMVQSHHHHHHHQKSSTRSKKNHHVNGEGVNLRKRDESNLLSSPKSVIVSGGEWESASGVRVTVSVIDGHGEGLRYAVRSMAERERVDHSSKWSSHASDKVVLQEAHILRSHGASTRATTTAPSSVKSSSSSSCDPAAAPIKADHHHHVQFDPAAWFEAKTSRLLNKILAEGSCGQQHEIHKKPARIMAHPIFPSLHKKTYMTRNFDPLNKQQHMTPKSSNVVNNNPQFDQAGVTNSKERNNISRKADDQVSVHEPIFLLDKRDLMTVNSRPASVTSPGLVHVARLYVRADTSCRGQSCTDYSSRLTSTGSSWGPKGLKVGAGFRCTCMYPGHGREFQLDHPSKTDTFTRTMTVVEPSKFSNLLQNLKSAYDSGKLWKSITQFKIARKIIKAMK